MFSVHKAIVARIFAAVVALDLFHNDMIQCKVDTSKTHRVVQNKRYYILVAKPVKFRPGSSFVSIYHYNVCYHDFMLQLVLQFSSCLRLTNCNLSCITAIKIQRSL